MAGDDAIHFFLHQDCLIRVIGGEAFDVIATNPPQMPIPPTREWDDAQSRADNSGPDGWVVLDRIIHEAPKYLKLQRRLMFTLSGFLGVERALEKLRAVGLGPRAVAREEQPFPRIAREGLDSIRSLDTEGILPAGRPTTCPRLVLCGQMRIAGAACAHRQCR